MKRIILALSIMLAMANPVFSEPDYTEDGELKLPKGYEFWVFVGTNLGLGYLSEPAAKPATFHNVYMETEAYKAFMKTGEFPDPTQFLFEIYSTHNRVADGEVNEGVFNDKLLGLEVAIKDSKRPTRPDSKEIWAYYHFGIEDKKPVASATAFPDTRCWACHDKHAGYDNVWVQLYPRLKARLGQ